jgi:hypothetical protein
MWSAHEARPYPKLKRVYRVIECRVTGSILPVTLGAGRWFTKSSMKRTRHRSSTLVELDLPSVNRAPLEKA